TSGVVVVVKLQHYLKLQVLEVVREEERSCPLTTLNISRYDVHLLLQVTNVSHQTSQNGAHANPNPIGEWQRCRHHGLCGVHGRPDGHNIAWCPHPVHQPEDILRLAQLSRNKESHVHFLWKP
ncbi:hypothetical protein OTU49_005820, partial [Cherax quadricarinatus]